MGGGRTGKVVDEWKGANAKEYDNFNNEASHLLGTIFNELPCVEQINLSKQTKTKH